LYKWFNSKGCAVYFYYMWKDLKMFLYNIKDWSSSAKIKSPIFYTLNLLSKKQVTRGPQTVFEQLYFIIDKCKIYTKHIETVHCPCFEGKVVHVVFILDRYMKYLFTFFTSNWLLLFLNIIPTTYNSIRFDSIPSNEPYT
jgi:hypothetical protein